MGVGVGYEGVQAELRLGLGQAYQDQEGTARSGIIPLARKPSSFFFAPLLVFHALQNHIHLYADHRQRRLT